MVALHQARCSRAPVALPQAACPKRLQARLMDAHPSKAIWQVRSTVPRRHLYVEQISSWAPPTREGRRQTLLRKATAVLAMLRTLCALQPLASPSKHANRHADPDFGACQLLPRTPS